MMFNNFIQWHNFDKRLFNFHNTIYFILKFFIVIGNYYKHLKNIQIFIFFNFVFIKNKSLHLNCAFFYIYYYFNFYQKG